VDAGTLVTSCVMRKNPGPDYEPAGFTHRMGDLARAAGVSLDIKRIRHYAASQMLAEGFDLGNSAARLGHSGGATTLKHYADPVSEV